VLILAGRESFGEEKSGRSRSGPEAVVEELAEANGEEKVAENGVVQACKQQRTRGLVGEGEQRSPNYAKAYRQPVAKNDVHEAKCQSTGRYHTPTGAKQRLIAVKEERPIKQLLWINRNQRVKKKDE